MKQDTLFLGESKTVEYKLEIPSQSERYLKTVVAFANGNGGEIVFGIDDKTLEIKGVDSDGVFKTIDAITNAIADNCEPMIVPNITVQTIDEKTIIVVEVLPGQCPPYYLKKKGLNNGTYVRTAASTRLAPSYTIKELILEGENRYYDSEICKGLSVTEEDIEKLCQDIYQVALDHTVGQEAKERIRPITKNVLLSWGVFKEVDGILYPTNAYALLTGKMKFPPVVQCAIFKGCDRTEFIDRREMEGSLHEQMQAAYEYVLSKINRSVQIIGLARQDVYELPLRAVREVIANAIVHRNYLEPNSIQVALYDDRLEVTSPGMLLKGVNLEKMKAGFSKVRNRALANVFQYMKFIEKWGSGIPRLYTDCEKYGLPPPEIIDFEGDVRVVIYRNTPQARLKTTQANTKTTQVDNEGLCDMLSADECVLIGEIKENPSISRRDLALKTGKRPDNVRYYLEKFKKLGLIERVGTSQKGFWKITR